MHYLLAEGIDPTTVNNQGETAIHLATDKPHILELFFDHYRRLTDQSVRKRSSRAST